MLTKLINRRFRSKAQAEVVKLQHELDVLRLQYADLPLMQLHLDRAQTQVDRTARDALTFNAFQK